MCFFAVLCESGR